MHHHLRAVVRSSAHRDASHPASRTGESDLLFEALAARRADTLRTFVIGQLAQHGGGGALARAFLQHARALRAGRGAVSEATWLVGVAGGVARELARGAARQLHEAASAPGRAAADLGSLEARDQSCVARRLSAQFAALSDELHDLLLLVATDAMSIDDAGLLLALPLEVANERLDRAIRALKHRLPAIFQRAVA